MSYFVKYREMSRRFQDTCLSKYYMLIFFQELDDESMIMIIHYIYQKHNSPGESGPSLGLRLELERSPIVRV